MDGEYGIYGGFASVYDAFMDDIPYDMWFAYLKKALEENGVAEGIVVDLACGTGEMTWRLEQAGYDMIGVDLSPDMLQIAREKCGSDVLFLCQDMQELDLYGSAAAMVCICDGMNYLCSVESLEKAFGRVSLFLDAGGIFIFDMKTEYFYREVLGNRTFTDNREDISYIWENEYHGSERVNEYLLTVYELVDRERDLFVRTDELHRQKAYPPEEVIGCLERQGFSDVRVYEAFTENAPGQTASRICFLAMK